MRWSAQPVSGGLVDHAMEAYDKLMANFTASNREERLANIEALVGGPVALLRLLAERAERDAAQARGDGKVGG